MVVEHWTVVVVIGFRGFFQCGCGDWVWGVGAKICGFMVVVVFGLLLLYFVGEIGFGFMGLMWVCVALQ